MLVPICAVLPVESCLATMEPSPAVCMSVSPPASRSLFITLEGIDGCGKSTQVGLLAARLRASGYAVVETAEPGGTRIGREIRQLLLDHRNQELSPTAELLLYFASRAQNVDERIRPALAAGQIVLCDRFTDSTAAYQGTGRALGPEIVLTLDAVACRGLKPDLTLLLDIEVATSRARTRARDTGAEDRLEQEQDDFRETVRAAYLELARAEPQRIVVVDARPDVGEVQERIWRVVQERLVAQRQADDRFNPAER